MTDSKTPYTELKPNATSTDEGTKPVEYYCRFCKHKGPTLVSKVPGRCQTLTCYSFLLPVLIPLSIIACVSNVFYETEHCCGKCHRHVALVKPCGGKSNSEP